MIEGLVLGPVLGLECVVLGKESLSSQRWSSYSDVLGLEGSVLGPVLGLEGVVLGWSLYSDVLQLEGIVLGPSLALRV